MSRRNCSRSPASEEDPRADAVVVAAVIVAELAGAEVSRRNAHAFGEPADFNFSQATAARAPTRMAVEVTVATEQHCRVLAACG